MHISCFHQNSPKTHEIQLLTVEANGTRG